MRLPSLVLLLAFRCCDGRSWVDVVDPAIFLASAIDIGRLENALEKDPFAFSQPATTAPTEEVILVEEAVNTDNDEDEEEEEENNKKQQQATTPTSAPTARYENIVGNGGCLVGTHLYEIRMTDAWGDGWDETEMRIVERMQQNQQQGQAVGEDGEELIVSDPETNTVSVSQSAVMYENTVRTEVFRGSLTHGAEGFSYACLAASKCYSVFVSGGLWEDEVKWEVRRVELGEQRDERVNGAAAAKGLAPEQCQFSIPEKTTGQLACMVTCGVRASKPTNAPADGADLSPIIIPPVLSEATEDTEYASSTKTATSRPTKKALESSELEDTAPPTTVAPSTSTSTEPSNLTRARH